MSICNLKQATERCVRAKSPMALFINDFGEIDVVFADTVATAKRIRVSPECHAVTIPRGKTDKFVLPLLREIYINQINMIFGS